jgi:predicted transcriptional regulator
MEPVLRTKPANIFLFLKAREPAYLSEIAKETNTTYVYVTNFVSRLMEKGLVSVDPKGKKKMISLTERGREIAAHVEEIRRKSE